MAPSMMSIASVAFGVSFLGLINSVDAAAFRGSGEFHAFVDRMRAEDVRAAVMSEVNGALGNGSRVTKQRLESLEVALLPMFKAMPKNEHGRLGHQGSRYVLHRLFEQRHGMYLKGLEPEATPSAAETFSDIEILEDRVPSFVQSLFEERMKNQGLGLHDLAVFAATLEHLIHDEAVQRLKFCYKIHNISTDSRVDQFTAEKLIDSYMMLFLRGHETSEVSEDKMKSEAAHMEALYPGWRASQKFAHQVLTGMLATKAGEASFADGLLNFQGSAEVVEEIGERYGRWQDAECRDLKSELLKIEDSHGRVSLKGFYDARVNSGAWNFQESIDYLRDTGALDESDPTRPSVIIPNYVNSRSNCLASSSIFAVCCINECEAIFGHLEHEIGAPEVSPQRLAALVAALPSATEAAPRELSKDLLNRLDDVSQQHGGLIPLHGRLFAQWLHYAYPRECPYPHVTGTTNPMTAEEWEKGNNKSSLATFDEMKQYLVDAEKVARSHAPTKALLWNLEENLVVGKAATPQNSGGLSSTTAALIAACAGMVFQVIQMLARFRAASISKAWSLPMSKKEHFC